MGTIREMMRWLLASLLLVLSMAASAVDVLNYVPAYLGTGNLGFDGIETTTVPFQAAMTDAGSPSSNYIQVALPSKSWVTAGSFYAPVYAAATVVQASSRFYLVACRGSNTTTLEATLYDYDPVSGTNVALATAVKASVSGSCGTAKQYPISFANSQVTVPAGHRLKVTLRAYQSGSSVDYVRIYDGSAGTNSVLTVVEGAGSEIGNCLAAGTYSSSWGVLRVFGSDGVPRVDYNAGDTVNFQFGGYQSFGAISSSRSSAFQMQLSATASTYASSRSLSASGTLYSYATSALSAQGAYYGYIRDVSDSKPLAYTFVNILPATDSLKFYSDAAYSVQTDTFRSTDTVYAILSSPSINFASLRTLRIYDFNNSSTTLPAGSVKIANGLLKFSFTPGTRLANGDWGSIYLQATNTSGRSRYYYRNLRRLDSGCTYCSATAPYDVKMSASTASSISLSWSTDFVGNSSYSIYRNGVLIASNVRTGSYTDNSLSQGTTYTYTVRGDSAGCESLDSNPVNAETLSNPGPFNARDCGTGTCGASRADGSTPASDNKLHTKVASTAFDVEVFATVAGFNKWSQVTAELWDASDTSGTYDSVTNCYSSYTKISPAAVALSVKNSKEVATFTVNDAYRNVTVKSLFSGSPASSGCSVDHFAIRPSAFSGFAVTDADWKTAGTGRSLNNGNASTGTIHRAGQPFSATTTAVTSSGVAATRYNGTPIAVVSALLQPTPASCAACTEGELSFGTWSAANGVLSTSSATYNEVGSFTMTLSDSTFAAVDATDGSTAAELAISSAATTVGRFVPDSYDLTDDGTVPTLTAGCSGASFLGQALGFQNLPQLTAQPKAADDSVINNLTGSLARSATNLTAAAVWTPTPGVGTINVPSVAEDSTNNPGSYLVTLNASDTLGFARPSLPSSAPFCLNADAAGACASLGKQVLSLDVTVTDKYTDGNITGSLASTGGLLTNTTVSPLGSPFYFGKLALFSALGTELVPLPVRAEIQVWNGTVFGPFSGSCTSPALQAGQVAVSFPADARNQLTACSNTQLSMTAGNLSTLKLSAPGAGKTGWADLSWNLGTAAGTACTGVTATTATTANATWLRSLNATGSAYDANPTARARFGVRGGRRAVYIEAR